MVYTGLVGSYASPASGHIVRFAFDGEREEFLGWGNWLPWKDTKYLSWERDELFSVVKEERAGIACFWGDVGEADVLCAGTQDKGAQNTEIPCTGASCTDVLYTEAGTSCHIARDGKFIYTANYHEGTVTVYEREGRGGEGKLRLHKRLLIREKAGCHQVLLQGPFLLVPCLNLDQIRIFDKREDFEQTGEIGFPRGSGPRHGVFDSRGTCFVVGELSNFLYRFSTDGAMRAVLRGTVDLLAPGDREAGVQAAAAAVRLSRDERFLYISLRFVNQVAVYCTASGEMIQRIGSGGDHPRDIALSPDDRHLFCANRFTGNVTVFRRDQETGRLTPLKAEIQAPEGVSIVLQQGGKAWSGSSQCSQ